MHRLLEKHFGLKALERLREDGYTVDRPTRAHRSWTFYFKAPGGLTIEVLA
jgi:lactoylglutathione lyase